MQLPALLKSRKFWIAVIGVGLVVLRAYKSDLPFTDQQITDMVLLLVSFIIGTGLEDVGNGYARAAARMK